MKHLKDILLGGLLASAMLSCDPIEDRDSMGGELKPSDIKFSVTQEPGYDNKVYLENRTKATIPYWEYVIGTSTRQADTIIFPFAGDYRIKFTAFGSAGSLKDSLDITISENDVEYFSDPGWELLTNGVNGKYWTLARITLGPASNVNSVWADVNWWGADVTNWNDSAYFDLDRNFNFIRFHNGQQTKSTFTFNTNEVIAGSVIPAPGKSIKINGDNQMNIKDGSSEMAEQNKTRYRIYKLTADTLIVGQGSYYTASRATPDQDWGFFHWYVKAKAK